MPLESMGLIPCIFFKKYKVTSREIWRPDMLLLISAVEHLHFRHGTYILLWISLSHKYIGEGIIKTQYKAMNTNEYQRNTETGGKRQQALMNERLWNSPKTQPQRPYSHSLCPSCVKTPRKTPEHMETPAPEPQDNHSTVVKAMPTKTIVTYKITSKLTPLSHSSRKQQKTWRNAQTERRDIMVKGSFVLRHPRQSTKYLTFVHFLDPITRPVTFWTR